MCGGLKLVVTLTADGVTFWSLMSEELSPQDERSRKDTEADDDEDKAYSTGAPLRRISRKELVKYYQMIIEDTYHHYYVTDDWTPDFYRLLATGGFISVAQEDYLIPEIQTYYCILDFPSLHVPKKAKKVARRFLTHSSLSCPHSPIGGEHSHPSYRLRMYANRDSDLCIQKIQQYWGKDNWLSDRYVTCLQASGLSVYTIELYLETKEFCGEGYSYSHSLLAGEVGYVIGGVYTSLTGFHVGGGKESKEKDTSEEKEKTESEDLVLTRDFHYPPVPGSSSSSLLPPLHCPKALARCCGTLQLVALGTWLHTSGFLFWNLGHPPRKDAMRYKKDLGGMVYPRVEFLRRWHEATALPSPPLTCSNAKEEGTEEGIRIKKGYEFDLGILLGIASETQKDVL